MDRNHVTALIKQQTNMIVQTGPFAGMTFGADVSWSDGDLAPKLLGTYEQELHPFSSVSPGGYTARSSISAARKATTPLVPRA